MDPNVSLMDIRHSVGQSNETDHRVYILRLAPSQDFGACILEPPLAHKDQLPCHVLATNVFKNNPRFHAVVGSQTEVVINRIGQEYWSARQGK